MEEAAAVDLGIGKRDVRDQEKDGLGLEFGLESTSPYDQHPQKLIRTDTFPFRTAASAAVTSTTTTSVASGAASPHLPPLHPSSGINSGRCTDGPTFYYNSGGIYDSYEAAARTLQPFPNSFKSQATGMGSAMALRYPLFTPAQWQELKRQALIYKHFVSSAPIPPDLLFDPRAGPSIPPLYPNLTRGSGYFNLRFTNNTDPEPGRCRRTDGKKWRCSRDVAPDQKYCERHMHRGRPRSRKPVEQRQKTAAATANNISTSTTTTTSAANSTAATNTATITGVTQKTYAQAPHAAKLPFLSMAPEKDPRYLDWMKDHNSNIGLRTSTPVIDQYEEQFKLNYSDLHDPCNSFLNPDLSSLDAAPGPDQRYPPRSFIDAWSNEKPPVSSVGKLPSPSTLTLSMSGGGGGTEDMDHIQMGLSINDSTGRSQPLSWMNPVTTLGGPLAEVLQSGTSTSSPHNSSGEGEGAMSRSYAGLINLMGRSCCGTDGMVSPRDSPPRGVVTSPTGVLQRTFVSLSDSSSNSSPTFRAGGGRSEMGCLQWMSQAK